MERSRRPLLTTIRAAEDLSAKGYPISPHTLDTLASRGGGPPYRKWGRRRLYDPNELLAWAEGLLGPTVTSSSEADLVTVQRASTIQFAEILTQSRKK
jgi:hypothetical protein